jgi:hypothetical protein
MNLPTDHAAPAGVPGTPNDTPRRVRRPSGEPPPLPHHLHTSGIGWLVAAAGLVGAALLVFAQGLRGVAVDVSTTDAAVADCW